jgi:hypothetical protein
MQGCWCVTGIFCLALAEYQFSDTGTLGLHTHVAVVQLADHKERHQSWVEEGPFRDNTMDKARNTEFKKSFGRESSWFLAGFVTESLTLFIWGWKLSWLSSNMFRLQAVSINLQSCQGEHRKAVEVVTVVLTCPDNWRTANLTKLMYLTCRSPNHFSVQVNFSTISW